MVCEDEPSAGGPGGGPAIGTEQRSDLSGMIQREGLLPVAVDAGAEAGEDVVVEEAVGA